MHSDEAPLNNIAFAVQSQRQSHHHVIMRTLRCREFRPPRRQGFFLEIVRFRNRLGDVGHRESLLLRLGLKRRDPVLLVFVGDSDSLYRNRHACIVGRATAELFQSSPGGAPNPGPVVVDRGAIAPRHLRSPLRKVFVFHAVEAIDRIGAQTLSPNDPGDSPVWMLGVIETHDAALMIWLGLEVGKLDRFISASALRATGNEIENGYAVLKETGKNLLLI